MKMKDNKGFSLVELVIVIAISTVLLGAIFYSYTLLIGQYARECANNLSTSLEKEKNYALTKSASVDCYMEIAKTDKGYVARYYVPKNAIANGNNSTDWELAEELKLGIKRVDIVCTISGVSSGDFTVDESNSIKFIYNRTSGAMKGVVKSDGSTVGLVGINISENKCSEINIIDGRKYKIEIFTETGKHILSRV